VEYTYNLTTGSSSTTWPLIVSSGHGYTYAGSTNTPRPQTALEWLDAEIEATCKLARQAG